MSKEVIELEDTLMGVKVFVKPSGEYVVMITVNGGTTNEWSLGFDEAIAKGKVVTILGSYTNGLNFVQEEVRKVFSEEEDTTK